VHPSINPCNIRAKLVWLYEVNKLSIYYSPSNSCYLLSLEWHTDCSVL
jgi:hypothetical protein